MNNRLFPRMCLVIPLIISFLFMPVNTVNASGYSSDADYWRWWYIEHQTDAITYGDGASAENIQNTDSGQTAGTVIYNQSGVSRGDFIDYVEEQYNQAEGYIQKGVDYYVDAVNHIYDSTVTAATKASYETQKAVREVVDASGNVIVDVSGSDFWHSAYNGLFNNNGYKDIYVQNPNESYTYTTPNGKDITFTYLGVWNGRTNYNTGFPAYAAGVYSIYNTNTVYPNIGPGGSQTSNGESFLKLTYDGKENYYMTNGQNGAYIHVEKTVDNNTLIKIYFSSGFPTTQYVSITIYGTDVTETNNGVPVLQPKQCGFIIYNGNRIPVYTDPSQNPFTVNDDGTVDYNGTNYPIYIDPDDLSPDGWLKILEFIDNEDETENPYNPQGQPWNTQNDGSILGGFFSNLISDIGNLFSGLVDKLKEIVDKIANFFTNFIDSIVDAIKKFIELFIGDLDLDAMTDLDITNPYDMIQDCYELLLEILGVNTT